MIVTREWINEFIDISNITTENICKALNEIGLEVDSVAKITIPKGIKIGFIESCEKHPDAEKLSICQVNLGYETVQIVCGAKNVAAGQYVPVATIGTKLGEDFIIKPSVLRGTESNGMICSSTEIGLPKMNDGILPLDNSIGELILGEELSNSKLLNDEVIEIELTPNRGDCLNILGIAKELSAYFNLPIKEFELYNNEHNGAIGRILEIEYLTKTAPSLIFKIADIEEFALPLVYKYRVALLNITKNTDIEIASAYVNHSIGVAFNIYTKSIAVNNDDKIYLKIDDNENGFAQIIGNIPLSTIGIEVGNNPVVDNIVVIEASYIEPTELAQKVFTTKQKTGDLYYKSSRGTNPNLEFGIKYFTSFLSKFGSKIIKGEIDFLPELKIRTIDVNLQTIHKIIGQEIDKKVIENILISLGFIEGKINNEIITFQIPNQRHDISNIADVAEEIVRLVGIDNIVSKPLSIDECNRTNKISIELTKKNKIRSLAIANNFYETTTYVFSSRELLEKYNFKTVKEELDILNPITSDLNTFRTTLLLNLIEGVSRNQKNGLKVIGLFEIGTVFDENRNESKKVGFAFSGYSEDENLSNSGKPKNLDLFGFASKISNCIGSFELVEKTNIDNDFLHPYQSATIMQNGKDIGYISKLHPTVARDFDLSDATFIAEINFEMIANELVMASEISKYQSSRRDLSVVAPKSLPYKEISKVIDSLLIDEIKSHTIVDIYRDENLGNNESLTLKFVLQSKTKTLEEDDIVSIMNIIVTNLQDRLNITLR
ncbi:MAG: phenylalanine--tRNA ligase subunit beta [Epsilonproteobacteria bacterium]|nr:phenylalanine--tRNA ligase subunit beta [Campylobacterota bacterium]